MTRLLLATILLATLWHYTAGQRVYASDLWRDARYHVEAAWPFKG